LCREDAKEISSRVKNDVFERGQVIGIIKEVAPIPGASTDEELGVGEFQSSYFNNYPLYMDEKRSFYSYFGNKSILSQPWSSWNPFALYRDFNAMTARLKAKGVDGNLKGEGTLKGGIIILHPIKGDVSSVTNAASLTTYIRILHLQYRRGVHPRGDDRQRDAIHGDHNCISRGL